MELADSRADTSQKMPGPGCFARLFAALAVPVLTGACASSGAVPHPFPVPGNTGHALVGTALSLRGVPYRNGGADPKGFDCSGFTQYVYARYGVALPREVREQFRSGKPVKAERVTAGDLLFFAAEAASATSSTSSMSSTSSGGATHVGIAIGGDQFVHAPSSTGVVRVELVSSRYWSTRYLGARRVND